MQGLRVPHQQMFMCLSLKNLPICEFDPCHSQRPHERSLIERVSGLETVLQLWCRNDENDWAWVWICLTRSFGIRASLVTREVWNLTRTLSLSTQLRTSVNCNKWTNSMQSVWRKPIHRSRVCRTYFYCITGRHWEIPFCRQPRRLHSLSLYGDERSLARFHPVLYPSYSSSIPVSSKEEGVLETSPLSPMTFTPAATN